MTGTMNALHGLSARAEALGVSTLVQSRFSDDVDTELSDYLLAADPQTVVLAGGTGPAGVLSSGGATQVVEVLRPLPAAPAAVAVRLARGPDGDAAVQVGAQLAKSSGLGLVLTPAGRSASALAADLSKRGIRATAGSEPDGAIVVGPAGEGAGGVHVAVVVGSSEASDDLDQWTGALDGPGVAAPGGTLVSASAVKEAGAATEPTVVEATTVEATTVEATAKEATESRQP